MSTRFFDVVVLGRSLGALSAAALLARREFRVLVLGHGSRPASYSFERFLFRRRTFTMLCSACPAWRRILHELAQSPRFRRNMTPLDPMFVTLFPGRHLELAPDIELFNREIEREFPEVRQVVDELYATLAQVNADADEAFQKNVLWPPGTWWERFETYRAASQLPLLAAGGAEDLLARFPTGHAFREVVGLPVQHTSSLVPGPEGLPPFAVARLHGSWTRGLQSLPRGEDELAELLVGRIEAHGGMCRLDARAASVIVTRGHISGVLIDGDEHPTGTSTVLTDRPGEHLAELSNGLGVTPRAKRDWPRLTPATGRFVTSLIVRTAGLPAPLPEESFLLPERSQRVDPRQPSVRLQRFAASRCSEAGQADESLLVAEILLPTRGALSLLEAREATLSTLRQHLNFLDEHLVAVDSTHDGLPLYIYENGQRREIDRIHVREAAPLAEPMAWQWSCEPRGYLGLSGEPIRGPVLGSLLVGSTVLPALGLEGELLAALGATRIITQKDGNRQRMRRQMWSRIETG